MIVIKKKTGSKRDISLLKLPIATGQQGVEYICIYR